MKKIKLYDKNKDKERVLELLNYISRKYKLDYSVCYSESFLGIEIPYEIKKSIYNELKKSKYEIGMLELNTRQSKFLKNKIQEEINNENDIIYTFEEFYNFKVEYYNNYYVIISFCFRNRYCCSMFFNHNKNQ